MTVRAFLFVAVPLAAVSFAAALSAAGQTAPRPLTGDAADDGQVLSEAAVVEAMAGHYMHEGPHLQLTPVRLEQPGDRQRAAAIVAALKPALERYRDYHVALQNSYEIFEPQIPQPIYHFVNYTRGFAETRQFQPDQATALLYRKTRAGYELIGAMYTAPANSSPLDLDARVPLSVTRWHQHVNICLPRMGTAATADWTKFGPEGSITAQIACGEAGGRFVKRLFGWMVHVYPFEKSVDEIWGMAPDSPGGHAHP